MLILNAALAALLAIHANPVRVPSMAAQSAIVGLSGPALARSIKTDLESIAGTGTVAVSIENRTHFSARVTLQSFSSKVCTQIYDRELELHQLYPDLTFDFFFDGPELARAIKADLESISGPNTVDISIDSKTLFNVRVAIPGFSSEIYNRIYDRALE